MSSKVFIVQRQMAMVDGQLMSKFDYAPAAEYGQLVDVLSPSAAPFNPASVIDDMHNVLFDYSDGDYLLLTGNPVLIGLATSIAAFYNRGCVRFLQWNGKDQRYIVIDVEKMYP